MSALLRQEESRLETQGSRVEYGVGVPKEDKSPIRSHRIQQAALEKVFEIVGDKLWDYGLRSGRRLRGMGHIIEDVREAFGYHHLSKKTLRRSVVHYPRQLQIISEPCLLATSMMYHDS